MVPDIVIRVSTSNINSSIASLNRLQRASDNSMRGIRKGSASATDALMGLGTAFPRVATLARGLVTPIGAIVGGVAALGQQFGSAVRTAATFERKMKDVQAVVLTGLGAEEANKQFERLQATALKLGEETEFSAREAAEAMEFLGMAGFSTDQILASVGDTLSLATVGSLNLGSAADIATNVLTQFNLEASQLGEVVDVISKTVTSSNTNVRQLAQAFKYAGPTFAGFNITLAETAATIGALGNAGLQGSIATRAFSTSITRVAKPTAEASKLIAQLGLDFFDSEGDFIGIANAVGQLEKAFADLTPEQRQANIRVIFGANAQKQWNALLRGGSQSLRDFTAEIAEAGTQQGKFSQQIRDTKLDTFEGAIVKLKSAWEGLQIAIGEGSLDFLKNVTLSITEAIRDVTKFIRRLREATSYEEIFGETGKSIDEFLSKLRDTAQEFASIIGNIFGDSSNEITAFDKLLQDLADTGLRITIEGFTALLNMIKPFLEAAELGAKNWQRFKEVLEPVVLFFQEIEDTTSAFLVAIKTGFKSAFEGLGGVVDVALGLWRRFIGAIQPASNLLESIKQSAVDFLAGIRDGFNRAFSSLGRLAEIGRAQWKKLLDFLTPVLDIFDDIKDTVDGFLQDSRTEFELTFSALADSASIGKSRWEEFKNVLGPVAPLVETIKDKTVSLLDAIGQGFSDVGNAAASAFSEAGQRASEAFLAEYIKNTSATRTGKDVFDLFLPKPEQRDAIEKAKKTGNLVGESLGEGIVNGLAGTVRSRGEAVLSRVTRDIFSPEFLREGLAEANRVMAEAGPDLYAWSVEGWQDRLGDINIGLQGTGSFRDMEAAIREIGLSTEFANRNFQSMAELTGALAAPFTLMAQSIGFGNEEALLLNRRFTSLGSVFQGLVAPIANIAQSFRLSAKEALNLSIGLAELGQAAVANIANTAVQAFGQFAEALGAAFRLGAGVGQAFVDFFKDLVRAILVDVPKMIGVFLIQESIKLQSWPLFALGVGLVGFSGILGGLIGGRGRQAQQTPLSGSFNPGDSLSRANSSGLGAFSQAETSNVINIGVYIDADGVIREIDRRTVINNELTYGAG